MFVRVLLVLALPLVLLFSAMAQAHEVRPTIATLTLAPDRTFTLDVDANIEALVAEIGAGTPDTDLDPNAELYDDLRMLEPASLEARFRAFLPEWLAGGPLLFEDVPANLELATVTIAPVGDGEQPRDSSFRLTGTVPEGVTSLNWAYPPLYGASVLRVQRPDVGAGAPEVEGIFLPAGERTGALDLGVAAPKAWWQTAWTYLVSGFDHIVPKGLDHILFVLGLFFLAPRLKPLLWQVSAFTLAHTVTLALGLYGVVTIAPSIVEPLIALSIVYVAVENIVTRELHPWRPVIVFLFGLLHGLGFAGVLAEFGLPAGDVPLALISFNIGVEAGQLFVLAVAALLVGWAFGKPWYRSRIAIPASLFIGLMGAFWFLERVGLIA